MDLLELADWRRALADLYAEVRQLARRDPVAAHARWRMVREMMYRQHAQSPVPADQRGQYCGLYFPYNPDVRFEVRVKPPDVPDPALDAARGTRPGTPTSAWEAAIPTSSGVDTKLLRLGTARIPFTEGLRVLTVFWMSGYSGGLYLPFGDATNGAETYHAGRYLLDGAKSADLGGESERTLIMDFNFAYQPSCAFDPRWACPLTPRENRLDIAIRAGERLT